MTPSRAIIVGGGIGGMTAALALSRVGWSVSLYERAPAFAEIGAGIMLTPNATRVLYQLGVGDRVAAHATHPSSSVYRRFDDATVVGDAPLASVMEAQYGSPYLHIHRSDLLAALTDTALEQASVELFTNHEAIECETDSDDANVTFANGHSQRASLLIACDGARSTLRSFIAQEPQPSFRNQIAWRGLVPAAGLPDTVTTDSSVVWIGPGRHIVQYTVRGGALVNYVAITANDEWAAESWNTQSEVSEVMDEFTGWHADVQALLRATPGDALYKWGLFDRDPFPGWARGNQVLLGDAAHPMLPFMAQGSAMAIEDAMILSRCLDAYGDLSDALAAYQAVRQPRTSQIILQSRAKTNLYQRLTGDKTKQRAANLDYVYGFNAITCELS